MEDVQDVPLLPCPFCGSTRVVRRSPEPRRMGAWCLACNAMGPLARMECEGRMPFAADARREWVAAEERAAAECAALWNARPVPAELEAARAVVEWARGEGPHEGDCDGYPCRCAEVHSMRGRLVMAYDAAKAGKAVE